MVVALVKQLALGWMGGNFETAIDAPAGSTIIQEPYSQAAMGLNQRMGRHGGVFKEYSTGGIARGTNAGYPAILHGTEAVVPLPNLSLIHI